MPVALTVPDTVAVTSLPKPPLTLTASLTEPDGTVQAVLAVDVVGVADGLSVVVELLLELPQAARRSVRDAAATTGTEARTTGRRFTGHSFHWRITKAPHVATLRRSLPGVPMTRSQTPAGQQQAAELGARQRVPLMPVVVKPLLTGTGVTPAGGCATGAPGQG